MLVLGSVVAYQYCKPYLRNPTSSTSDCKQALVYIFYFLSVHATFCANTLIVRKHGALSVKLLAAVQSKEPVLVPKNWRLGQQGLEQDWSRSVLAYVAGQGVGQGGKDTAQLLYRWLRNRSTQEGEKGIGSHSGRGISTLFHLTAQYLTLYR